MIEVLQLIVLIVLAFCLIFGLGFIVNMLLKTTWLPIYLYVPLIAYIMYSFWDPGLSFSANLFGFTVGDAIAMISGLAGAFLSGRVIRWLRLNGYKMF